VLAAETLRKNLDSLSAAGPQQVELADGSCHIGGREVPVLDVAFPPYERILPDHRPALRASFEVDELRGKLQEGDDLAVFHFEPESVAIGFNRDYLLQALEATRGPDVLLEADSPVSPCLIRSADEGSLTYVLMPIKLLTPA
jgi:DNA polymerase-3 subunit beta